MRTPDRRATAPTGFRRVLGAARTARTVETDPDRLAPLPHRRVRAVPPPLA